MKCLPDVMRKKTLGASLVLSLIASMALMGMSKPASADPTPIVSLNPMELEVPNVGVNFTIDVNITNVEDLGCFDIKLGYNTTILDAIYVNIEPPLYPENDPEHPDWDWLPEDEFGIWHPDGPPTINDTAGIVWVGALVPTWAPGTGLYGDFTLVSINFTAKALGNSTLHFHDVVLGDWRAVRMDYTTVDTWTSVIPEFPAALIMPLLLITTLATALLGKMFWSRKRKERLQKISPP